MVILTGYPTSKARQSGQFTGLNSVSQSIYYCYGGAITNYETDLMTGMMLCGMLCYDCGIEEIEFLVGSLTCMDMLRWCSTAENPHLYFLSAPDHPPDILYFVHLYKRGINRSSTSCLHVISVQLAINHYIVAWLFNGKPPQNKGSKTCTAWLAKRNFLVCHVDMVWYGSCVIHSKPQVSPWQKQQKLLSKR